MQLELAKIRQQQFAKPVDSFTTPPPKRTRESSGSKTKSTDRKRVPPPPSDESEKSENDMGDESVSEGGEPEPPNKSKPGKKETGTSEVPETTEAAEARLRRICETKPSGRCHVTKEVHDAWARGGASREALMKEFQKAGFNKETTKAYHLV